MSMVIYYKKIRYDDLFIILDRFSLKSFGLADFSKTQEIVKILQVPEKSNRRNQKCFTNSRKLSRIFSC
jgi:hypothetical protein